MLGVNVAVKSSQKRGGDNRMNEAVFGFSSHAHELSQLRRFICSYKRFAASSASSERSPFWSSTCAAMAWARNLLTM